MLSGMAGYSGTPLVKKLGIKADTHAVAIDIPEDFDHSSLEGADVRTSLRSKAEIDVAIVFCRTERNMTRAFERIQPRLAPAGALWIAWPKRASSLKTELSGDIVRTFGLDQGLVDNKVCAIDDTWSGLRFVIRVKDRARYAATRKRS
jgi:hypothetical protein